MDLQFVIEINRKDGQGWMETFWPPRNLESAIPLREYCKTKFPEFMYRVVSVVNENYYASVG